MLDPVSAVSFAASIVQLIAFTEGLCRKTAEVYRSADGCLVQHTELETIIASFAELVDVVDENQSLFNPSSALSIQLKRPDAVPTELDKLAASAKVVVKEITELLCLLRGDSDSNRVWRSVRHAILSVIKENKLEALEQRLNSLRNQINSSLIASLW